MGRKDYPSLLTKLRLEGKKKLESNKKYCDLMRSWIQAKEETVDWEPEVRYIDPNDIDKMQMGSSQMSTRFRHLYNTVSMHKAEKGRFNPYYYSGVVLGGDWDKNCKPHKFDRVYRGLREHYEEGKDWHETEYITQYIKREELYQKEGYTQNQIDIIESLYESIKQNGLLTAKEYNNLEDYLHWDLNLCGIIINIGRNGEYIFNNIAHNRLGISKILDLDEIPVMVAVRHENSSDIKI